VIAVATPVEHHRVHAGLAGALTDELADLLGGVDADATVRPCTSSITCA
jgi:hypothetical protein